MLAHTHGQPATPTTVGKEFANVVHRLRQQMQCVREAPLLGKIAGATGSYQARLAAWLRVRVRARVRGRGRGRAHPNPNPNLTLCLTLTRRTWRRALMRTGPPSPRSSSAHSG